MATPRRIDQLPPSSRIAPTDLFVTESAGVNYKGTGAQILDFIGENAVMTGLAPIESPSFTGMVTIPVANIQSHYGGWARVSDAATIYLDMSLFDKYSITANPTIGSSRIISFINFTIGQVLMIEFTQAATGGPYLLSWPSILWPGGIMPVLTTSPSKSDIFMIVRRYDGSYTGTLSLANF